MLFLRFKEYHLKKCLNNFSSIRLYVETHISAYKNKSLRKEAPQKGVWKYKPLQDLYQNFLASISMELTVQIIASLRSEVNLAVGLVLFTFHSISMKM